MLPAIALHSPLRTGRFSLNLLTLAAGGGLVGLAITLAFGGEEPFAPQSWIRTLLLLTAVVIAAGVGALIDRAASAMGRATRQAAANLQHVSSALDHVSSTLDHALRRAEAALAADGPDERTSAVQDQVDAVSRKLDSVNAELTALRRSGNRTAWMTFLLGTLLGVVTQVTL